MTWLLLPQEGAAFLPTQPSHSPHPHSLRMGWIPTTEGVAA
eukprot:CAMPEP_0172446164 /NCGR_PEP_ID=MMETSP1065-20121228/5837_1 /TAXON_ID=265537 /ORGANISM="Amphiprora paludosa, Strain CCMP125" /LENGTH=40 /DNA_ID= /DNA_START= /DNA_END= /DNA_ORIENTATION=